MADFYLMVLAVGALLFVFGAGMMLWNRLWDAFKQYRVRRPYGRIYQRYPLG